MTAVPTASPPSEQACLLSDLALARRLERTEGLANAGFVQTRARLDPGCGATWIEVAGVYAMFDGIASPLTQTFGLGLFDPIGDTELDRIEEFFLQRGAPVVHEISPLADSPLLARLNARGYQPLEFSNVLVRPTTIAFGTPSSAIEVRRIAEHETARWAQLAGLGWSSESAELGQFVEQFALISGRTSDGHSFLAELNGEPIATGSLYLSGDIALLAGASTIPSARRQGAQLALLHARLRYAAERGAALAMMVAQPGSPSQRNAQRQGFQIAYTRLKWQLIDRRP